MSPIQQLLCRHGPIVQPNGPIHRLERTGGLSGAELWSYPSRSGRLVIRGWPPGVSAPRVQTIHHWLNRLRPLPFLAQPIPGRDGATVHIDRSGRCWELAPWLAGRPSLQPTPSTGQVVSALDAVGKVHEGLMELGSLRPSPGLQARVDFLQSLTARECRDYDAALSLLPREDDRSGFQALARAWIQRASPRIALALASLRHHTHRSVWTQPCLRDLRPEHLLFEGERLTGLVDYGAMDQEAPEADLARLLPAWIGDHPAIQREARLAYQSSNPGHVLDEALMAAFAQANSVLIGAHWLRWILLERRRFDDPAAPVVGLRLSLRLMEEETPDLPERPLFRRPD